MRTEVAEDGVRVGEWSWHGPFKGYRLVLADKAALLVALIIAAAMSFFWILGMVGLWGSPLLRFDHVIIIWTLEAELALAPPIWLFFRVMDIVVGVKTRWWQASRYAVRHQTAHGGIGKLSESLVQSRGKRNERGMPKFAARKSIMLREYHVLVIWPDGCREKIGRFGRRLSAARCIVENSADWLARRRPAESLDAERSLLVGGERLARTSTQPLCRQAEAL